MLKQFIAALPLLAGAVLAAPPISILRSGNCRVSKTASSSATVDSISTNLPTPTMTLPVEHNRTSNSTESSAPSTSLGRKNVLYFTNWGIYGANFTPQAIPVDEVTHLLYAFAGIAQDGSVVPTDLWADVQKPLSKRSEVGSGNDTVHGSIQQLYLLKKKNRNLKTLLSIGGFTASQEGKFKPATSSTAGRQLFASTAVKLLADWGFDGIDIDYEYPTNKQEASDFVALLKECRDALDNYAKDNNQKYHYLLTVAAAAGPQHYNVQDLSGMDQYLDSWHLMAYDYAGGWDSESGDQSNVYPDPSNPTSTKFSTNRAVEDYISQGISPSKIVLGLPLYGRSFMNTDGLGKPFSGVGQGSIEKGIWLYRDLPRSGSTVHVDRKTISAYSYDSTTKELVSFDNVETAKFKAKYLMDKGLGGAVFWEASGDKAGEESLVKTLAKEMGGLEHSKNMLEYPTSQYDNIKHGMLDALS